MVDKWLECLSFKQQIAVFLTGVVAVGFYVSAVVLLANYTVWQAALTGLFCISAILLVCIVRVAIRVVRLLRS